MLARLKYLPGSENVYMQTIGCCKKIYILKIIICVKLFWFATDIKTILFFVHHKNYGRIEIVGILLARLKYMSGSENVYMQIIGVVAKNIY